MDIPEKWKPVAEGVNGMRDLFQLALVRGSFHSIEENARFLEMYSKLEWHIKQMIQGEHKEEEVMEPKAEDGE